MILLDFPLYLMETFKCWHSLHGYIVVFMFLTTFTKGSPCEAPSSPQCFRRNTGESIYRCEWSMNTTESNVRFDLYFNETKFGGIKTTWTLFNEEQLIKYRPVDIWVEAHVGNSSCTSTRTSVELVHTVKYEAPQNISMSWSNNNLNLTWRAAEKHPALVEIRFRRYAHPTESWETRLITANATDESVKYQSIVVNLQSHSAYQVQIRYRSKQPTINSLWSDWSSVVIVPAELAKEPEVTNKTEVVNGTRKVTLTWKLMSHEAAVTGVTYNLTDIHSTGCPCEKWRHDIKTNSYTTYVSYFAVNFSLIARNAAGYSPPAIIQVPAKPAADLKTCDKTLLDDENFNNRACFELYKHQDGDSRPENVITSHIKRKKKKDRKKLRATVRDCVRYVYFEHRCDGGKSTVKTCLFYQKECVPLKEPQDVIAFGETQSSVDLSWKAIPSVDQQGFLTHYSLCSIKTSSQNDRKECRNISASLIKYRLENLTPGTKYNVSLVGVTRVGEGPKATVTINTLPEKPVNVWWSLGLLFVFFLISTMCTFILKRIKNKILPPVPTPVIQEFTSHPTETQQDMLERKEEVDELTLYQLHPEGKSIPEDAEETAVLTGEWDYGTDEDVENVRVDSRMSGRTSDECDECLDPGSTDQALRSSREGEMTDLEQVENEIAMLIYRNGLVFDVKTDSP